MPSSHETDTSDERFSQGSEPGGPPAPAGPPAPVDADSPAPAHPRAEADGGAPAGELARIEDLYKRALADLDNYRKRSGREVERRMADAKESMLLDWLDAVDSVERAIQMEPDGACQDGLRAVLAQMDAVLQRQGAQRIGAPGDHFDPDRHEAIAVRASEEVPDRTVLEVPRSGFALGERVIRPAQAVVARRPEHAH